MNLKQFYFECAIYSKNNLGRRLDGLIKDHGRWKCRGDRFFVYILYFLSPKSTPVVHRTIGNDDYSGEDNLQLRTECDILMTIRM